MEKFIEKYIKQRKDNKLYIFKIAKGSTGLFVIILFSFLECYKNYAIHYYITINFLFICLEYVLKMDIVYKEKRKLCELNSINEDYNEIMNMKNMDYIYNNIISLGKEKINLFYRYICDTKELTSKFDYIQVLLLAIGSIIGASFTANGEINLDAFKNSIYSTGIFLLSFGIYFYSIKLIIENARKLKDDNNAKIELIEYINQIEYNNLS